MSLILNIDTATDKSIISIADNGIVLQFLENSIQKDHASFLHTAIIKLLTNCHIELKDIDAIAVINGPGSYTGIRVGMASAKGLCFALNKPLITVNTLAVMANSALQNKVDSKYLLCPLLDARRMEAFFAVYTKDLNIVIPPQAVELHVGFLTDFLSTRKIIFFGNAVIKWQNMCTHTNAHFIDIDITALSMANLSYQNFITNKFDDIYYSEPLYLKEFYNP